MPISESQEELDSMSKSFDYKNNGVELMDFIVESMRPKQTERQKVNRSMDYQIIQPSLVAARQSQNIRGIKPYNPIQEEHDHGKLPQPSR